MHPLLPVRNRFRRFDNASDDLANHAQSRHSTLHVWSFEDMAVHHHIVATIHSGANLNDTAVRVRTTIRVRRCGHVQTLAEPADSRLSRSKSADTSKKSCVSILTVSAN